MNDSLLNFLRKRCVHGIAVAFSGGVDSTLLLNLLVKLRKKKDFPLYALTMHSVFHTADELQEVRQITAQWNVPLKVFEFDPFSVPGILKNPPDRCYLCKNAFFSAFRKFAQENQLEYIMDGTNADDLKAYRPGLRALKELEICSPFAELGITKKEIRSMCAELGLKCADKPAVPCLATRFTYGTHLTPERIQAAADGERILHEYLPNARNIRFRVHDELVRIELDKEQIPEAVMNGKLIQKLKQQGFRYITFDAEGFRSGSMDIGLPQNKG